jgi:hypothetical protein
MRSETVGTLHILKGWTINQSLIQEDGGKPIIKHADSTQSNTIEKSKLKRI